MKYFVQIILIALSLVYMTACQSPPGKVPREKKFTETYYPGRSILQPDYSVHHVNDSMSVLYIRVYLTELLFNLVDPELEYRSRVRFSFELRKISDPSDEGVFADSASIVRSLVRDEGKNSFFTGLPLNAAIGNKYSLRVTVQDELRGTRNQITLIVDKSTRFTAQNYKLIMAKTGIIAFKNIFTKNELFKLEFNRFGYDSIHIDYYHSDESLPRPVFSTLPEVPLRSFPDTSWSYAHSDSTIYELGLPGTYIFRIDKSEKEGLTLMNFGDNFPYTRNADDMLGPLVYLTSSVEFRDLRMHQNRKLAVDNFWLGISGNPDAARELIRVFYNRVLFANIYFTSYKEGWKTDRGMIYIVFGVPNLIDITAGSEKWTYLTGRSTQPVEFVFERKENIFSNMDYKAVRDVSSNPYWRSAVQSWRKGKIYSSSN